MAQETDLKDKINYESAEKLLSYVSRYDKEIDTLTISPAQPIPTVSVDVEGYFWLRINPENCQIAGVEVENYITFFSECFKKQLDGKKPTSLAVKQLLIRLIKYSPNFPSEKMIHFPEQDGGAKSPRDLADCNPGANRSQVMADFHKAITSKPVQKKKPPVQA